MSDQKIGWKFENSESGDIEGLNDGGIETFRDDHLLSLAKECAQNSLDAQKNKNEPVILEFKTFYIDKNNFPDLENFKNIIEQQIKFWKKTKYDKSSEDFFKDVKNTLKSEKIFCLRVSDFNTTGLDGSREGKSDPLSKWFKLVRSRGLTDNNPLAGGSFGLGKFASFACSKLRTVFYSTKDVEGVESHQGVSILASYDDEEGKRTRGRGYFCNKKDFSCLDGPMKLDPNFKRNSVGTDIYVVGFIDKENGLEDELFSSILRSFLLAIYKGNLIFKLNGRSLEKDNLKRFINQYRAEEYNLLMLKETIEYYDLLEGHLDYQEYKFSMMEEKDVSLKIAIRPGLSRKVGVFRNNGMKIFDKKGIKSYNDFTGTLCLEGDKVNAYFRKLENPEHNDWRAERSNDVVEAKEMIKKLFNFITKNLKDLEDKTLPESENIEGVDALPDDITDEEGLKPIEGLKFRPLMVRESKTSRLTKKKIKSVVLGGNKSNSKNKVENPGSNHGKSSPGEEINTRAVIEFYPSKIKIYQDKNKDRILLFTIPENVKSLNCSIVISGEEINEVIKIEKASILKEGKEMNLKFSENNIQIGSITKNVQNHIKLRMKDDEKWALEVRFYENQ